MANDLTTKKQTIITEVLQKTLGKHVVSCAPLTRSGGYSLALRLQVQFADGTKAFVKVSADDFTAQALEREVTVYEALGDQPFLAQYLGLCTDDDGDRLLLLEDLSTAYWGPPWRDGDVERVLRTLSLVRPLAHRLPPGFLPSQDAERNELASWKKVAANPEPFLSLKLCSRAWLKAALPALLDADEKAILDGDDLVHQDIRSDNLCFTPDGRAILVDWNWACYGNGKVDIAGWLPSLYNEGGPLPDSILPQEPQLAAILAGFWAANAGLPTHDFDPTGRIRHLQRKQVSAALPWAVRTLGLPPLTL